MNLAKHRELAFIEMPVMAQPLLDYLRKAGGIVDAVMKKAIELTVVGAYEGGILAEMHGVVWRMDGDPTSHRWPAAGGEKAMLMRYTTGRPGVGNRGRASPPHRPRRHGPPVQGPGAHAARRADATRFRLSALAAHTNLPPGRLP